MAALIVLDLLEFRNRMLGAVRLSGRKRRAWKSSIPVQTLPVLLYTNTVVGLFLLANVACVCACVCVCVCVCVCIQDRQSTRFMTMKPYNVDVFCCFCFSV